MILEKYIATVPDFPIEGILFRDITPLMQNGEALRYAMDKLSEFAKDKGAELIVGPEARGFLFGTPVATLMGVGFVPVRKPGKLPREVIEYEYDLEYGSNIVEIQKNAIKPGDRVIIVDDLLATGGTMMAATKLIENLGGEISGIITLIELTELGGRDLLKNYFVHSIVTYPY